MLADDILKYIHVYLKTAKSLQIENNCLANMYATSIDSDSLCGVQSGESLYNLLM